MAQTIKLALLQMTAAEDAAINLRRTLEFMDAAADAGAQIVSTQELFLTPYFCQTEEHRWFEQAESIPGATTEKLGEWARRRGVVVVASLFERRLAGLYHNSAVVLDADGRMLGHYRKMHIPDDPHYYEKFYFTPGDLGFPVFATRFGRLAVQVCWDQWFPEGARMAALGGAELLIFPTAIGWHPAEKAAWGERQRQSWEIIQRSHAVANGFYVAAANRVGWERPAGNDQGDGIEFWGHSFISDPSGQFIAQAAHAQESIVTAELDLEKVNEARTHWPFLRDRRIEAYGELSLRARE